MQTSWTAIFGAVAALEGLVLVRWSEKIYKIWSRLYLFIVTRWPWCVTTAVEAEKKAEVKSIDKKSKANVIEKNTKKDK